MSGILDDFLVNWLGYIPGIGAAIISIMNWLELRKGADITPLPFVNYGLWAIKSGEKTNKVLILPLSFNNDGVKNGLIVNIEIAFIHGNDVKPIQIRRKIRLNEVGEQETRNMDLTMLRNRLLASINPSFPIPVYAHEGNMAIFEGFDGENAIPIGKETICRITVDQQNGKSNSIEFPFTLSAEQFDKAVNNLTWY
jgi:hypothetical protein